MAYTNWDSFKDELHEDTFNYLIKLDDKTKDKITGLLPFPIKDFKELDCTFYESFLTTIEASIYTLQIIDETYPNPFAFPITELPDRINFVDCSSTEW